jgi:enoyl-CoA hydratase
MTFENSGLQLNQDGPIAELVLNRPEKANALDGALWSAIGEAFQEIDETSSTRVVILRGAGKHFCAGIDLSLLGKTQQEAMQESCEARKRERLRRHILELQDSFTAIERCRKPVLAAIHGACIGAGVDLVTACDLRYSTAAAVFQVKEVDLAITADVGTLQRLPHLVTHGVALELSLTARKVFGSEAQALGLVNRCFEAQESLLEETRKLAQSLADKSPLAVQGTKEILLHARDHSVSEGLRYVAAWNAALLLSDDLTVAAVAMMQKRLAQFRD